MDGKKPIPATTDEYIAGFPTEIQQRLLHIRAVIKETVPEATEKISYAMPGFYYHGNLVWFAAHTHHLGFYPGGVPEKFKEELNAYKWSKGAVQFPYNQPLPVGLIVKITQFRAAENLQRSQQKKKK